LQHAIPAAQVLESKVLLAADLEIFDMAVYDFGDITVRDLGIKDHIPVLVGDMWDSVEERQVGRVMVGDGNGGFDVREVGSLGDGDTALQAISENGMFVGGFSDSPTSVSIGQGFVASLADLESLTAIDYANQTPISFLSNPVFAVTNSADSYGDAEGGRLPFIATADGHSVGLPGDYIGGSAVDTVGMGGLSVGVARVSNLNVASVWSEHDGFGNLSSGDDESAAKGVSADARFIVGESLIFDPVTFTTTVRAALWRDIDGVVESPASQRASDYELVILQTPTGDFENSVGLSVTTVDGKWLASGTSETGAWIYHQGMDGPRYLADILADEGADIDWDPQAVERVRYDSETGWLHMAVSGSSYYVGLQIAEPDVNNGPIGNIDGDSDFDANDSFLMQLILLAGTDDQVDQSKGSSSLTASQIREAFAARSSHTDVDGDGDTDANDGFLIHLVQLSGTNEQIELSKGASSLTAEAIRANVNALGNVNDSSSRRAATSQAVPHPRLTVPLMSSEISNSESSGAGLVSDADRNRFWQDGTEEITSPTSRGPRSALPVDTGNGKQSFRHWIDVL